jgi:peptidoglycan/xylan/chitin deacetylase (PgdA/CDA1 family)
VFLTFDDGPDPEITPFVLDLLKNYNWKATFFCVGENILKNHELYQRILSEGHTIGNHTMRHEKGTETEFEAYLESVKKFNEIHPTRLFRPPYGKITNKQKQAVGKEMKIIMWSWLTYDFDLSYPSEQILKDANKLKSGDIVVLHDNSKFRERNIKLFEELFEKIRKMGFDSTAIPN